ncbi:serine/threonine-protein kinase [Steroidobacter sp.]|uniref:serine/threonine-protein kinase n=1 Tax=Steroidobacter sp. TaxID=1978227 RepID=UPI001A3E8847|nr:serine/threonine-protein kinase [Steroidobacter sp.]MBL8270980.1 serine/threonine protein kinase [Steroidobacter sp.]
MTYEEATRLLGLRSADGADAVRAAFDAKRDELEQRLAAAPTDGLRAKYESAIGEAITAYELLMSGGHVSAQIPAALSYTQVADLPGAAPSYTRVGERADAAQLGLRPGLVLAQRYKLRRVIGQGGMGAVYEAFDELKQESIALKVLLPHLLGSDKAKERFLSEAKIACKLSHPNIVKVFDVGVSEPYYYLTMELLAGQTLRQRIDAQALTRTRFEIDTVLAYAQQLIAALEYAHRSIVHRDLKPENIWIDESGQLKLMDFGIARTFSNTELTKTGMALGTAYYMAPEQFMGKKQVDARADQYSLAVILYELLTGWLPQGAAQTPRALRSDVPSNLSAAIMKAINPVPDARFADLQSLDAALRSRALNGVVRWSVVGVAAAAILAAVFMVAGPAIRGWLPDSAAQERARVEAIRTQAQVVEVLKRIDVKLRELDEAARGAEALVERLSDKAASVRSESERDSLRAQLATARARARLASEIREISRNRLFGTEAIVEVKGHQALGESHLKDGQAVEAAAAFQMAYGMVTSMLTASDRLEATLTARDALGVLAGRAREVMDSFGGDGSVVLQQDLIQLDKTHRLLDAGEVVAAHDSYLALIGRIKAGTRQFLEQISSNYAVIAQRKLAADELEVAQTALERAKSAKQLQAEFE